MRNPFVELVSPLITGWLLFIAFAAPGTVAGAVITVEGDCRLPSAIRAANLDAFSGSCPAGSGDDTIRLTDDVVLLSVEEVYEGHNGLPLITSHITIEGQHHTISRDPDALAEFRIVSVSSEGELWLSRVTLTGGVEERGGGIFNAGVLIGEYASVSNNLATFKGGGIYNAGGSVFLFRSTVSWNRAVLPFAEHAAGGAIWNGGELDIYNSTVADNRAGSLSGFTANAYGGAIEVCGSLASLGLSRATISDNVAEGTNVGRGGAIYLCNGVSLAGFTSTISGNSSSSPDSAAVEKATAATYLRRMTFAGNRPHALRGESTRVQNTLFAHSEDANCLGTIDDRLNNASDDASCGSIPDGLTGLDPSLADNGGLTRTHALLAGSNAIDASSAEGPWDQRSAPPVNARDIGAFEYLSCPTRELFASYISAAETHEDCAVRVCCLEVVGPEGALTLRAGTTVTFFDGVSVGAGAALTVELDGALQLVVPELVAADRARRRDHPGFQ